MVPMKKTTALIPTVLAGGLLLAGCTSPATAPATTAPTVNPPAATAAAPAPTAATTDAPRGDTAADAAAHNAAGGAAAATAEAEVSGTAIQLDHDDQRWEVEVLVGDRVHDVTTDNGGTAVTESDRDEAVDGDDARRAAAATVSLVDAMKTALEATPGVIDDVELDDRNGAVVWEVTIDTAENDDVDVYVDAATGAIQA